MVTGEIAVNKNFSGTIGGDSLWVALKERFSPILSEILTVWELVLGRSCLKQERLTGTVTHGKEASTDAVKKSSSSYSNFTLRSVENKINGHLTHKAEIKEKRNYFSFSRDTLSDVIPLLKKDFSYLIIIGSFLISSLFFVPNICLAENIIDANRLANAIFWAEGGTKTRHPYGILAKYKTTTPRQACLNTIKTNIRKYKQSGSTEDFITFMGKSYCPIGAKNDPTGLNKNWVKNVKHFYKVGKGLNNDKR